MSFANQYQLSLTITNQDEVVEALNCIHGFSRSMIRELLSVIYILDIKKPEMRKYLLARVQQEIAQAKSLIGHEPIRNLRAVPLFYSFDEGTLNSGEGIGLYIHSKLDYEALVKDFDPILDPTVSHPETMRVGYLRFYSSISKTPLTLELNGFYPESKVLMDRIADVLDVNGCNLFRRIAGVIPVA